MSGKITKDLFGEIKATIKEAAVFVPKLIADEYDISVSTVRRIKKAKNWREYRTIAFNDGFDPDRVWRRYEETGSGVIKIRKGVRRAWK